MTIAFMTRRALAVRIAAIPLGAAVGCRAAAPKAADGLTHAADAIRQEVVFKAKRQRVYEALTDSKQFDAVTRLSDALALVTAVGAKPTTISLEVGGSMTLFGGYVTGRNLEMLPGERLVQAWRAGSWKPGEFSVVRFVLSDDGENTKLVFDHGGFPAGQGDSLAAGWHSHYWTPMAKYLAA